MLKRTITGAFITVAVYLTIYFSYIPTVILGVACVLSAFAVYEIYRATDMVENEVLFTLSIVGGVTLAISEIPYFDTVILITFIAALVIFTFMMLAKKHLNISKPVPSVILALVVVLLFKSVPELRAVTNGLYYLTTAVTLCFVTDIAAYLIGRSFGRHKLIPSVSPNKTVEGSLAGVVFALLFTLIGGVLAGYFEVFTVDYGKLCIYAVAASLVGEFGDLAMSVIKRICKIKDFGNLFPGHGGILDRFDSHMFTVAFTLVYCNMTGGFIR